mgnify:CR=1 FL=1
MYQDGTRDDFPDLIIKTKYTTGKVYTNLDIKLNKSLAENIVTAELINLVGVPSQEIGAFNYIIDGNDKMLNLKSKDE